MIVSTPSGRVRGRQEGVGLTFLGVPYAGAPYPEGPFEPPRPSEPWTGVLDAFAHGASPAHPVVAHDLFPDPVVAGPNPLNLDVYAPADTGRPQPVLVWLPGGGFFTGSNASPWYTGESFVRDGVVVVVPNYRLAAEGFAILDDGTANRALLDVCAALEWVHSSVAAFGGDPDNVTVAGQSAGATATLALVGCPGARGLFRRLAVMSAGTTDLATADHTAQLSASFAAQLGVPASRTALSAVPVGRRLDLETAWLPEVAQATRRDVDDRVRAVGGDGLRWRPTLDGRVVTASPAHGLAAAPAIESFMIGTTTQEWNFRLGDLSPAPSVEACREALAGLGRAPQGLDDYLRAMNTTNPGRAVAQALTDHAFRAPARGLADAASTAGVPTYTYQFAWSAPRVGAAHCVDLPFVFDHLDAPGAAARLGVDPPAHLAASMHDALVHFVRHGDPGWSAYDTDARRTQVFDHENHETADALGLTPRELHAVRPTSRHS